ncbi:MAG: FIST N-terminal domain-containing protein [Paracoccus sp. (in: a-proteobacteria)]|nr:FIST N-terminal domain-containing protein [Paracoccus sp. (in: a-proteobacteria)]
MDLPEHSMRPSWPEMARNARRAVAPASLCLPVDDPALAAARIAAAAQAEPPALMLLFASPAAVLRDLVARLAGQLPPDCQLVACSSAGEFADQGYVNSSVVAVLFPAQGFRAMVVRLRDLPDLPVTAWMDHVRRASEQFAPAPGRSRFGILLTDGAAGQEEVLTATLDAALPWLNVVGGTVGEAQDAPGTVLMHGQDETPDCALLCMVESDCPVREIVFSHFTATSERMVVTEARSAERLILRLNDEPAADEYARLIGVAPGDLTQVHFARHPLLLRMGAQYHVRAIASARADGALQLMCSIEQGSVLTLGEADDDLCRGLDRALSRLPEKPAFVLGFDCILRRLAVEKSVRARDVADLFARHRIAGFNTFGEQHGGMHVNQTFVGLAFMPHQAGD